MEELTNQAMSNNKNINNSYEPVRKRRWSKIIVKIFIALIVIAVLLFSLPYILSAAWGKDAATVNDSDLLLSVVSVPREENSYFDLLKLSSFRDATGLREPQVKMETVKGINDFQYLETYDLEADLVTEFIDKNKGVLAVFSQAASRSQFQLDITADPVNITNNMPMVSYNAWRMVARISAMKAVHLMKQGEDEAAFKEAIKIIKIGQDIQKSKNVLLIPYTVGLGIQETGLETIQILLDKSSLPSKELSKYQDEIRKYQPVNNDDAFKTEYLRVKSGIEDMKYSLDGRTIEWLSGHSYYFKPSKTINLMTEKYRQIINNYNRPCDQALSATDIETGLSWQVYFTENSVGKILANNIRTDNDNLHNTKCSVKAMIGAIDISFAIKKFYWNRGLFPENLQILNPDYITIIPSDPFSGQPFIMNEVGLTIHSVGPNHEDDIGSHDDLSFSYDFSVLEVEELLRGFTDIDIAEKNKADLEPDTDGDGLTDNDEINRYFTDPNNPDTDGDGYSDGDEVANGYSPLREGTVDLSDNLTYVNQEHGLEFQYPRVWMGSEVEVQFLDMNQNNENNENMIFTEIIWELGIDKTKCDFGILGNEPIDYSDYMADEEQEAFGTSTSIMINGYKASVVEAEYFGKFIHIFGDRYHVWAFIDNDTLNTGACESIFDQIMYSFKFLD